MKIQKFKRLFACLMALILIGNIVVPPVSQGFALAAGTAAAAATTAVAGTAATAGTTATVAGGGVIAGYVAGGVGVSATTYATTISFLTNLLICCGLAGGVASDVEALNLVNAYKREHSINGYTDFREVAELRKLEYGGIEYDVFELAPQTQQYLMDYYFNKDTGVEGVEQVVSPNLLVSDTTVSSGYGVDVSGNLSPLMYYNPDNYKLVMCDIQTNEILSSKGIVDYATKNNIGDSYDFNQGSDGYVYIPYSGLNTADGERSQVQIDYFNNEMWRTKSAFASFVNNNPISCILELPDEVQAINDANVIDTWKKCQYATGGVNFTPLNDDNCPSYNFYTSPYSGNHVNYHIKPNCLGCQENWSENGFYAYAYSGGATAMDLYLAIGPKYSFSTSAGYDLSSVNFRIYYPNQYYSTNFEMDDLNITYDISRMCSECQTYYKDKFLVYNSERVMYEPALGCSSYKINYSTTSDTWNVPDFTDETKSWVMAVESGATYEDIVNGDATLQWVDLNSVGEVTELGSIDSSQWVEVPFVENTGDVSDLEGGTVNNPSAGGNTGDNPDYGELEDIASAIQEWIYGGITFNPSIVGDLALGSAGAFSSLGDSITAGTFTGIQLSNINDIQQALNSSLATNSQFAENSGWDNTRNPNVLDLLLLIMRVLFACVCLVVRALVFIATLSLIPATTSILPEGVVLGIDYFKTLSWGSLNLYSLVVWFCTIMFGISVIMLIKRHYRT